MVSSQNERLVGGVALDREPVPEITCFGVLDPVFHPTVRAYVGGDNVARGATPVRERGFEGDGHSPAVRAHADVAVRCSTQATGRRACQGLDPITDWISL